MDQRQLTVQDGDNNGSVKKDVGAYEANLIWESEIGGYVAYSDLPEADVTGYAAGNSGLVLHSDNVGDYITMPMHFAESGTYTVSMRPTQVSDTAGNFVAAGVLGAFQVNVPAPPSPAEALASVAGLDLYFLAGAGGLKHDGRRLLA